MKLNKWFLRQPCLAAASVILIVLSVSVTSGKTNRANNFQTAGETVLTLANFNAVGDGVADDGPALQRALDALADGGGGTLLIPAGQYLIATPVEKDFSAIDAAQVIIQGLRSDLMPAPPTASGQDLAASLRNSSLPQGINTMPSGSAGCSN